MPRNREWARDTNRVWVAFFFQAEDGIRDIGVTGVQTCALPIWERGAQVVLGGLHALSCPEEVAPHADALALGEGVQLWPTILRDVEAGRLRPVYQGSDRKSVV